MEEELLRKMAMEQFLKGKSPTSIYGDLGRSMFGVRLAILQFMARVG
jgi:hypothetical protein